MHPKRINKVKRKGRAKIQDEFTNLQVSRQRKCQLRRQKEGLCIICGQPRVSPHYCLNHLVMARERQRNRIRSRRRNTGSKSYQLEAEARKTLARQRVRNKGRLAGKK